MRSTIACERKSKVKCVHDGKPPCRGCVKSKNTASCVLSGPVLSRPPRGAGRTPDQKPGLSANASRIIRDVAAGDREVAKFFDRIPSECIVRATAVFQAQFPEFGFLHPRDHDSPRETLTPVDKLRCLAILAVSLRYMNAVPSGCTSAECAAVVTRELQKRVTSTGADSVLVQTYLIMALHEWGESEGFSAWMYAGIAARMAQGCILYASVARGGKSLSEPAKRTVWSCFTLDKLLCCGSQRPAIFRLEEMRLPLPISDEDYAFDSAAVQAPFFKEFHDSVDARFGSSDYFSIILQGLHIWARIHTWVVEGGRKGYGMTEPHNSPWREGSEWGQMKASLMRWRERQTPRLRYPETKVSAHAHLRRGETFGFINLIYYLSLLFLCREYIPFLPLEEIIPRGPIDPPLLKEYAPDGFWLQNRDELFDAAAQMSNIMRDLRQAGAPIHTPFTGLCAFVAALMNRYAVFFAQFVGPEFASMAEERAAESVKDLRRICDLWSAGQGWLEVLDTAERLYRQVTSADKTIDTARENHLDLEASINLAPLSGMPAPADNEPTPHTKQRLDVGVPDDSRQHFLDLDPGLCTRLENDGADAEGWRLWAFWDDPHMLSTVNGPEGAPMDPSADHETLSPEEAMNSG